MDPRWCPVLFAALAVSLSSPAVADRKFGKQLGFSFNFCISSLLLLLLLWREWFPVPVRGAESFSLSGSFVPTLVFWKVPEMFLLSSTSRYLQSISPFLDAAGLQKRKDSNSSKSYIMYQARWVKGLLWVMSSASQLNCINKYTPLHCAQLKNFHIHWLLKRALKEFLILNSVKYLTSYASTLKGIFNRTLCHLQTWLGCIFITLDLFFQLPHRHTCVKNYGTCPKYDRQAIVIIIFFY